MKISKRICFSVASLLLFHDQGWTESLSLTLTDDASIHGNNPTLNQGSTSTLTVHSVGPKQGLVRFDAASIAGLDVNTATLNLYLSSIAAAGSVSIYAITSSWNESTVTWSNQPPAEAAETAVVSLATSDAGSVITIDVTDVVQRWADGSLADAGFLIVTASNIRVAFDTKEKTGGVPATLEVDTGPPAADLNNVGIGKSVLSNNTKGSYNTAVGNYALEFNTIGDRMSAFGFEALHNNTNGGENTAIGYHALWSNTTGYYNTAIGTNALYWNTFAEFNVAIGFAALWSNTGYDNTATGSAARLFPPPTV